MMIHRLALITLTLGLGACATTAKLDQQLDAMKGQPSANLIQQWGAPQYRLKADDGRDLLVYVRKRSVTVGPMPSAAFSPGTGAPSGPNTGTPMTAIATSSDSTSYNLQLQCMIKFYVQDGRIQSWTHLGNDCISRSSTPTLSPTTSTP